MDRELRILILEDSTADAELEEHELIKSGLLFSFKVVDTREAFLKALDEFLPNVILSDYDLPTFDGLAALKIAKEKCPDVPFILVSGKLGEEFAIEKLKEGATDYVLKSNLKRLVPSVNRALEEAKERTERKRSEEVLKQEMLRRSILMDRSLDGIVIFNQEHELVETNQRFAEMLGYTPKELVGMHPWDWQAVMTEEEIRAIFEDLTRINVVFETRHRRKDGTIFDVELSVSGMKLGDEPMAFSIYRDITERKRTEEALKEREKRYRLLFNNVSDAVIVHEISPNITEATRFRIIEANDIACQYLGYTREELLQMDVRELDAPEATGNTTILNRLFTEGKATWEDIHLHKDGHKIPVEISNQLFNLHGKTMVLASARDITERKRAEESLKVTEAKFRSLAEESPNMIFINYKGRVVYANKKCVEIMGYTRDEFYAERFDFRSLIVPEYLDLASSSFQKHMQGEEVLPYEYAVLTKDGNRIEVIITTKLIEYGNDKAILGIITDITERKKNEEEMRNSKAELSR